MDQSWHPQMRSNIQYNIRHDFIEETHSSLASIVLAFFQISFSQKLFQFHVLLYSRCQTSVLIVFHYSSESVSKLQLLGLHSDKEFPWSLIIFWEGAFEHHLL